MNEEEGAARSELGAADLLDPNPDILGLFCHYNDIYFDSKLHACTVDWSTSRMTLCAGICKYAEGSCAIRLSEPLLKFRSSNEVKDTLLHEMIHAYLWLTDSNNDHNDHGPCFQKMMQAINNSQAVDHQRPTGGYHITIFHKFSDEVNSYRKHHWKCIRCGDVVKRANNRPPSQADCYQKTGRGNVCSNERCHWHRHQQLCGGDYEKIAEPEGYRDRRLRARRSGKEVVAESKVFSEVHVNKEVSTNRTVAVDNLETKKIKNRENNASCHLPKNASLEMYFSSKTKCNDREEALTATEVGDHCSLPGRISSEDDITEKVAKKRTRRYKDESSDGDGFCSIVNRPHAAAVSKIEVAANSFEAVTVQKNECTVIIGWKSWYAFEGEEDEKDNETLKNKRSQRRMFERASSHVVNLGDPASADSPGVPEIQDPVSFNRKIAEFREDKAGGENVLSPVPSRVSDCFVTNVVGVNDYTPKQLLPVDDYSSSMPLDPCAMSHAKFLDSVTLGHNESVVQKDLQVGVASNPTLGLEDSSTGAPILQEAPAYVFAKQMSLVDQKDCASVIPFNREERLPVILNRSDQGTMEVKSEKSLEVEDVLTMGKVAEVSEVKTACKGRSKRPREDNGRSKTALVKEVPSAVCPICQTILLGNIEDANFNNELNQHIDACMSDLNNSCPQ